MFWLWLEWNAWFSAERKAAVLSKPESNNKQQWRQSSRVHGAVNAYSKEPFTMVTKWWGLLHVMVAINNSDLWISAKIDQKNTLAQMTTQLCEIPCFCVFIVFCVFLAGSALCHTLEQNVLSKLQGVDFRTNWKSSLLRDFWYANPKVVVMIKVFAAFQESTIKAAGEEVQLAATEHPRQCSLRCIPSQAPFRFLSSCTTNYWRGKYSVVQSADFPQNAVFSTQRNSCAIPSKEMRNTPLTGYL